jgi:hypothetical protein
MDDSELWTRFETQHITPGEWNHRLHLRTAYLHLTRFELDEAHLRMRAGIIRLNQSHGLVESAERGYFETVTRAWIHLVQGARLSSTPTSSVHLLQLCPELLDSTLPLRYYTKTRLFSVHARAVFVPPDLKPLPCF